MWKQLYSTTSNSDSGSSSTDEDINVGNDEEHDNCEDFFSAYGGSSNGPSSSKTASHGLLLMLATQLSD
jgi:hypothetical protein